MNKKILSTAAIFGMIAIILGAFGAHALKKILSPEQIATFETGVRYQMYHALFLLFIGTNTIINQKRKKIIHNLTLIGVIFFSGSIYLLATNSLMPIDFKIFGFITPIGGLFLISAWFILLFDLLRPIKKEK
ncbi:DUF423 domain-containing protein [Flavobacterium aquiphilum]|uniref:DUF423 domain-containing protein n=1 Tax=Flavobacterium aquiphilum TaxID=3003261 RepID=UPI00247FCEA3|nr:DUF423 domain-containing protein [Flavobacterium aquiphilum]